MCYCALFEYSRLCFLSMKSIIFPHEIHSNYILTTVPVLISEASTLKYDYLVIIFYKEQEDFGY